MEKKKENAWKVVREYQNVYSVQEMIQLIIRKHMENEEQNRSK